MIKANEISIVPTKDIKENLKNRNKHPQNQINRLVNIIKYQGFRNPLIISNRTGFLVAGHGRLIAAKKLKMKNIPVIYQDFDDEAQEYAAQVSDNAIASWSELDLSGINSDIGELGPDFDIDLLGIKGFEIDVADRELGDEDATPEVPVEPKSKLGDVWILGNHRLMCGDYTSIDSVEKLMDGQKADMVYTDPPYGMNLDVNYEKIFKYCKRKKKGDRYKKIIGDDFYFDPTDLLNITFDIKEVWLWGADYFYDSLPRGGSLCSWDKRTENLDRAAGNTTEFLWSKQPHRRMTARVLWTGYQGMGKDDDKKRIHPTQKPITLHEWFFENFGNKKELILDLFGGSGSTLIACEKLGKKCFMMELDPKYCDVILSRWAKYTGKDPVHENGTKWNELND